MHKNWLLYIILFKNRSDGGDFLIGKAFSETHYLDALDRMIRRLSTLNPKREALIDEYNRIQAGDFGEKVVIEVLEQLQLPYHFYVFHNLSLLLETRVQFDVLFLTAHYIIILEVKNIKGTVVLRQNPSQLVRTLPNGEVNVFNSPEPQLEEYMYQLKSFFLNKGLNIPIYGAIVFPFTSSFIEQNSNKTTILRKNELKSFIRNISVNTESITDNDLESCKNYFLSHHKDFDPYPLIDRYNILRKDILNGVFCEKCGKVGMRRIPRYWVCPSCNHKSTDAHKKAIYDYLQIINNSITNTECREFLGIRNPNQSYRMIQNMNLIRVGKNRCAKYMLHDR